MTWNNQYKDGKPIKEHTSWVNALIKLNGKRFASGSEDKQILIFDYNMKLIRRISCKFQISALCNKFNNNIIYDEETYNNFYVGDYEGRVYLYNFSTQNFLTVSENDQHNSRINQIIQLYGANYCTIAQESKIIIHDADFNPIQSIINNEKNKIVNCIAQQTDGKVITGNQLGQISIYE
jgi:WD40 repeat protein